MSFVRGEAAVHGAKCSKAGRNGRKKKCCFFVCGFCWIFVGFLKKKAFFGGFLEVFWAFLIKEV